MQKIILMTLMGLFVSVSANAKGSDFFKRAETPPVTVYDVCKNDNILELCPADERGEQSLEECLYAQSTGWSEECVSFLKRQIDIKNGNMDFMKNKSSKKTTNTKSGVKFAPVKPIAEALKDRETATVAEVVEDVQTITEDTVSQPVKKTTTKAKKVQTSIKTKK